MPGRRQVLRTGVLAAGVSALAGLPATAAAREQRGDRRYPGGGTLVIGHRGASGYRPEHTLASYTLAAHLGADFIEPDLVSTRDHVLVARHEPEISGTTDVATRPEFRDRRRTILIDGAPMTGWFTEDFTLAELKSLWAVERLPELRQRNTIYDGLYQVPTFGEVLALRERLSRSLRREIGVYPETKHPTYFRSIGLPLEEPLVADLRRHGLDRQDAAVFVQSFEAANLRDLRRKHGLRAPTVFLAGASGGPFDDPTTYAEYLAPAGLRRVRRFADGIGPDKNRIIPRAADGILTTPTSLIADAHAVGLVVHPYTFRAENQFLPANLRVGTDPAAYGRAIEEQLAFLAAGVDGVFADQPDIAVVARDLHFAGGTGPGGTGRGAPE